MGPESGDKGRIGDDTAVDSVTTQILLMVLRHKCCRWCYNTTAVSGVTTKLLLMVLQHKDVC